VWYTSQISEHFPPFVPSVVSLYSERRLVRQSTCYPVFPQDHKRREGANIKTKFQLQILELHVKKNNTYYILCNSGDSKLRVSDHGTVQLKLFEKICMQNGRPRDKFEAAVKSFRFGVS
jgi:hypothetical protein